MDQKVALVTGANRGLGLEIARQLGREGVTLIVSARSTAAAVQASDALTAEGISSIPLALRIGMEEDYVRVGDEIDREFGRLDILVNNAGVDGDAGSSVYTASSASLDDLRYAFEIHFFEVVRLTQTLLPLLRLSDAGRIVNMSAVLGSLTIQSQNNDSDSVKSFVYNSSKTALNAFTVHLAAELKSTPMKVFSAHPGWVKTDHGTQYADLEVSEGARTPVALALDRDEFPTGSFVHEDEHLPW